jgi:hypothetical protein
MKLPLRDESISATLTRSARPWELTCIIVYPNRTYLDCQWQASHTIRIQVLELNYGSWLNSVEQGEGYLVASIRYTET